MTIIDRYILRTFCRVLLICFCSLTGLFIVIDAFGNLEEFITYGEQQGGLLAVLVDYYQARVFTFFDRTSPLLALISTLFTITWLQRHHEMTALLAAGIPQIRIVRPLILAAIGVSLLGVVNREYMIPSVRDKLARNAQDWLGDTAKQLQPRYDNQTDILLAGRQTLAAEKRILNPSFRLHTAWGDFGRQLIAEDAFYHEPRDGRPGGYLLCQVRQPEDLSQIGSVHDEDRPVILSPKDTPWLQADQCFVASGITFQRLAGGNALHHHASLFELIGDLQRESLDFGADVRVTIHSRLVQPLLDLSLLCLGLPLVLSRESRNIFVVAGMSLLLVSGFYLVILASHALGNNGYLLSPALAAWLPLIVFGTLAYTFAQPLWSETRRAAA